MPAPPPMKISVNVPMNSATPRRRTFSSIERGFWEGSRTEGLVQLPSLRGRHRAAVELRGRVPPLSQELQRRDDRARRPAVQAEAKLDHLPLAHGERAERHLDVLATERELGRVERRLGRLVLHEVAEGRILFLADRLLERDR